MIFKTYKSLTGLYSIVVTNYNCGKIEAVIVNINSIPFFCFCSFTWWSSGRWFQHLHTLVLPFFNWSNFLLINHIFKLNILLFMLWRSQESFDISFYLMPFRGKKLFWGQFFLQHRAVIFLNCIHQYLTL